MNSTVLIALCGKREIKKSDFVRVVPLEVTAHKTTQLVLNSGSAMGSKFCASFIALLVVLWYDFLLSFLFVACLFLLHHFKRLYKFHVYARWLLHLSAAPACIGSLSAFRFCEHVYFKQLQETF